MTALARPAADSRILAFVEAVRHSPPVARVAVRNTGPVAEFILDLDDPWATNRQSLSAVLAQFDDPRLGMTYRTVKARWQQPLAEGFEVVYTR